MICHSAERQCPAKALPVLNDMDIIEMLDDFVFVVELLAAFWAHGTGCRAALRPSRSGRTAPASAIVAV